MAITYVGVGTAKTSAGGSTGSLVPTLPSGLQPGDLVLIYCSGRGSGYVFSSSGYTAKWHLTHASSGINRIALLYRFYQSGDGNPTVSWTGGGTNQTVIMQICAFRGVDQSNPFDVQGATSSNASQANIGPISGITTGPNGKCIIVFGHRADDWTSVATLSGDGLTWAEIGEPDTTSGTDAGEVWDYAISSVGSVTITNKTFTVTGGTAQTGMGVMQSLNEALVGWRKLQYGSATFGKTTIGGSQNYEASISKFACKFTLTEAGDLTKISVYCRGIPGAGSIKCAVYSDSAGSPSALLGSTQENTSVICETPAWYDCNFASPLHLEAGTYWLSCVGSVELVEYYDAGGSNQYCERYTGITYEGEFTDPFGAVDDFQAWETSIYATYTPLGIGWRKLKYASEPPVPGAWNKLLYEGE